MSNITVGANVKGIIEEYQSKKENIQNLIIEFDSLKTKLSLGTTVRGHFGSHSISLGYLSSHEMEKNLLVSSWRAVAEICFFNRLAPADDKRKFEHSLATPPPLTFEMALETFGDYLKNPRFHILKGLAQVFCSLDPFYKSHNKVKIGTKGLPKRVILSNAINSYAYGHEKLKDTLNALATYQMLPMVEYNETSNLSKLDELVMDGSRSKGIKNGIEEFYPDRGVTLKMFMNGNVHIIFNEKTLNDINLALAEFYGDVLPDAPSQTDTKQKSTSVSKDLQYYPTPKEVVEKVLDHAYVPNLSEYNRYPKILKVLEPSCGCGRIMDLVRSYGHEVVGVEYDQGRANQTRSKGHNVTTANFLEIPPTPIYDRIIMNPPFYGKHWKLHVEHALKFLTPDGILATILPASAKVDDDIKGQWTDLPIASFRESGTNVSTGICVIRK